MGTRQERTGMIVRAGMEQVPSGGNLVELQPECEGESGACVLCRV